MIGLWDTLSQSPVYRSGWSFSETGLPDASAARSVTSLQAASRSRIFSSG